MTIHDAYKLACKRLSAAINAYQLASAGASERIAAHAVKIAADKVARSRASLLRGGMPASEIDTPESALARNLAAMLRAQAK